MIYRFILLFFVEEPIPNKKSLFFPNINLSKISYLIWPILTIIFKWPMSPTAVRAWVVNHMKIYEDWKPCHCYLYQHFNQESPRIWHIIGMGIIIYLGEVVHISHLRGEKEREAMPRLSRPVVVEWWWLWLIFLLSIQIWFRRIWEKNGWSNIFQLKKNDRINESFD